MPNLDFAPAPRFHVAADRLEGPRVLLAADGTDTAAVLTPDQAKALGCALIIAAHDAKRGTATPFRPYDAYDDEPT